MYKKTTGMLSGTAVMLNETNSILSSTQPCYWRSVSFEKITFLNAEFYFCSGNSNWPGISVSHIIFISSLLKLLQITQPYKQLCHHLWNHS